MRNGHMPYGYRIENGIAKIDEEQAEQVRKLCEGYLSGMGLTSAAKEAGFEMAHTGVMRMMLNRHYLGDDFYPQILTEETQDAIRAERDKRAESLGRKNRQKTHTAAKLPATRFRMSIPSRKFKDPFEEAEYIFGLIEEEG